MDRWWVRCSWYKGDADIVYNRKLLNALAVKFMMPERKRKVSKNIESVPTYDWLKLIQP